MRDVTMVVGLGYGDEGKGSIVDYLARKTNTSLVVRYNGGAQAAHNVITPEGDHHTFAQFGSGSFTPGSATFLSEYMLVNPLNLYTEGKHLVELGITDIWERLFIDSRAKVITPWHVSANRIREEARGGAKHGSCGQGIGETVSDELLGWSIRIEDLLDSPETLKEKLKNLREFKRAQLVSEIGRDFPQMPPDEEEEYLNRVVSLYMTLPETVHVVGPQEIDVLFERPEQIIFEGAQGVLLDQDYGWHPHTTWSKTTTGNAHALMLEYGCTGDVITTMGVTRAYATRHGAGPFPTETSPGGAEAHNKNDKWQGQFRIGVFDGITFDYALNVQPVDELALTCLDQVGTGEQYFCAAYDAEGHYIKRIQYLENASLDRQRAITELLFNVRPVYGELANLETLINIIDKMAPIRIASYGPTALEKSEVGAQDRLLV